MCTAFAISTICFSATVKFSIISKGLISEPNSDSILLASFTILPQSTIPNFLSTTSPAKMFSTTVTGSKDDNSWYITLMPLSRLSFGPAKTRDFPSITICPVSREYTPARIFIKVDLPAPFSPRSPSISPFFNSRVTSSRALTPGKFFIIFFISSNWSFKGIVLSLSLHLLN